MAHTVLTESVTSPARESKGVWRVRLIEGNVHGSSGYYPSEVLLRDGPQAFPAGTQVYFDHPTDSETWERPERSVRDMAGVLIEDAAYETGDDGSGLFARVQFFPHVKDMVASMSEAVGMSIRATGINEDGVITRIIEGTSVDLVTRAGAGGRLIQMTESARTPAPQGVGVFSEAEKAGLNAIHTKLDQTTAALAEVVNALKESAKKPEPEKEEVTGLTTAELVTKLDESELPAVSRKRLAEAYKPGDDFDAMITAEKQFVTEVMESAKKGTKKDDAAGAVTTGVIEESGNTDLTSDLDRSAKIFGLEV